MIKSISNNISFCAHYYVTGHKSPDLDSVASSVATVYLAEQTKRGKNHTFEPIAAGDINAESEFALAYFGITKPTIKNDLSMTVGQVMKSKNFDKVSINQNSTIGEFIDVMQNGVKSLAVLNDENEVVGMISLQSLAKHVKDEHKSNYLGKLKYYNIPYDKVARIINAEVIVGDEFLSDTIAGGVSEATCSAKKISELNLKDGILIVEDREDIQKIAIEKGVKTLIISYNENVSQEIIDLARENNVIIMRTKLSSSEITSLLKRTVPVSTIMSSSVISFSTTQSLEKAVETVRANKFGFYPVLDKNNKFMGLVAKEEILAPQDKARFILVDHNDIKESPKGVEESLVDGIIDHHKSTFSSSKRMNWPALANGANATNVALAYRMENVKIPSNIAGLLWCAIVSDTDNFKSPTTTERDIEIADELAQIAGIKDKEEFVQKLLSQNDAEILKMSPAKIVSGYDSKEMEMGKFGNVQIAQIKLNETSRYIEEKSMTLLKALNDLDGRKGSILGSALIITDKKKNASYLIVSKKLQKLAQIAYERANDEFLNQKFSDKDDVSFTYGDALKAIVNQTEKQNILGKFLKAETEISISIFPDVVSRKDQVAPFVKKITALALSR